MKKILNPIKYFQDKKLLTINLLLFCLGTFLAIVFNVRFDGVLDVHFFETKKPILNMTDNIINIIILTIMLFVTGKIINRKTRMIDCLNTAFYARIPIYFLCFTNIGGISFNINNAVLLGTIQTIQYVYLIFLALISILGIIASVIILFQGFKVASNAKKSKHYVYFFIGLVIAEIVSGIILKNL